MGSSHPEDHEHADHDREGAEHAGDGAEHADHDQEGAEHAGDGATMHHRFEDAEHWAEVFEDPERDSWQQPEQVLAWLQLAADARVADIGSATGYFPVRFAQAAPDGIVYGLDIEPNLVNYLNLRAQREGLGNLVSLVCEPDNPHIPEPVDLIFICDTYHHIDARKTYFGRLTEKLRAGGRLVVVDFKPGELPVGPPPGHKLSAEQVRLELEDAGFQQLESHELEYQYFLVFGLR